MEEGYQLRTNILLPSSGWKRGSNRFPRRHSTACLHRHGTPPLKLREVFENRMLRRLYKWEDAIGWGKLHK
jgi:hypothetical protein